jgi:tRNA A37 threonylcarbamoyltransferase TsaD
LSIAGGVSANKRLRQKVQDLAKTWGIPVFIPPIKYCTDNAVMVANYARLHISNYPNSFTEEMLKLSAYPTFRRKIK